MADYGMPVTYSYITKRLFSLIFVVFGVLIITFILTRVIPARPEVLWAGPHAPLEAIERARRELHLDEPIHVQLMYYLENFFKGNWGVSWRTRQQVLQDILSALPATLELVIVGFTIAIVLGIPLGFYSALRTGSVKDDIIRTVAIVGASMPVFWTALILQLIFGIWLKILPAGKRIDTALALATGFRPITGFYLLDSLLQGNMIVFVDVLKRITLPAITVSLYPLSLTIRMVRSIAIEVLNENFVRFLEANGISKSKLIYKHVLKNVISPVIASLGLSFGYTIIGAFMVELVFVWPGIGYYAGMALLSYDYPAVLGSIVFIALFYSVINLVVDVVHAWIDPS
ncbi:ABC transporter permease [Thermofilum sp.]|uniref:ABC transporter permease n=1 Tax=Thermofilum sp. TaxID=1961369 RepID=UPI0031785823